jgi:fluoride exporter
MTVVWFGIVIAGAIGAPTRFLLDGFVQDHTSGAFPWGTFVINMTGSIILGFITGLALYHAFPTTPKIILGTGFCGAYTTFSTWTFETIRLLEEGAVREALLNAGMSLIIGMGAAGAGLALAAL